MELERLTRDQRKERTRQVLLAAAGEVFVNKGFSGASIDMIADAAGYTKGAVYFYFKNKEELLYSVIKHRSDLIYNALNEAPEGLDMIASLSDEENQKALVGDWFDRKKWMILFLEYILYMQRNPKVKARFQEILHRDYQQMVALIEKQYTSAGIKPPMPATEVALRQQIIDLGFGVSALIDDTISEGLYHEMSCVTNLEPPIKNSDDA